MTPSCAHPAPPGQRLPQLLFHCSLTAGSLVLGQGLRQALPTWGSVVLCLHMELLALQWGAAHRGTELAWPNGVQLLARVQEPHVVPLTRAWLARVSGATMRHRVGQSHMFPSLPCLPPTFPQQESLGTFLPKFHSRVEGGLGNTHRPARQKSPLGRSFWSPGYPTLGPGAG